MGNFQYKSSSAGAWTDVPKTAYHGTYEGSLNVIYPEAQARSGVGRPCAAIGEPHIYFNSKIMTASGMAWWQDFFSTSNSLDAEFWLTARDPYTDLWTRYTGWLMRPTYSRLQIGTGSTNTMYFDVEITVEMLTETT